MPEAVEGNAPVTAREAVLRYAGRAVATRGAPLVSAWATARELLAPVGLGAAATVVLLVLLTLRGAVAEMTPQGVATASVTLSVALALVLGTLTRPSTSRTARSLFLGALGGLAGCVALNLLMPLSAALRLCRHSLLGEGSMSIWEVCLVYFVIVTLYAGVPLAIAAYAWSGKDAGWRGGLAEAAVFAILATPLFLLQAGFGSLLVTGSVVLGLAAGSLAGGVGGVWIRARGGAASPA
jgi:hypothetical protein